ncbi:MAG: hypothetical protein GWP15_00545, partial [Nitrospirae bacterium]|nr:hypothetical protein [Nitrospirota bacterium]
MFKALEKYFVSFLLIIALLTVSLTASTTHAAVPHYLGYEGYLTDTSDNAITSTYNMTFRIYDALSGGNLLWTETHPSITVTNGYFSVQLGSVTALSLNFDIPYWISFEIVGDTEMTPRQPINSVGYSYFSDNTYALTDANLDTTIDANTDDQIDIAIAGADDFQFVANILKLLAGSSMETDTINETTGAAGVTIDGIKLKDGGATVFTGGTNTFNITNGTSSMDVAAGSALNVDANLTVESASFVNQDLTTDASVAFTGLSNTDANITNVGDIALDSISSDGSNISIGATNGTDILQIGDGTYTWGHAPMVGIEGILEVDGASYFDGGFSTGGNLDMAGNDILNVDQITGNSTYITVGDVGAASTNSLVANDDLLVGGKLEVDGATYLDSTTTFVDDLTLGSSAKVIAESYTDTTGNIWSVKATPGSASTAVVMTLEADGSNWASGAHVLELITDDNDAIPFVINNGSGDVFTFNRAGSLTMAGNLIFTGGGQVNTSANGDLTLLPNGTGITIVGDAGATSHALNANDDLFVNGQLEVDGNVWADGTVYTNSIFMTTTAGGTTDAMRIKYYADDGQRFHLNSTDNAGNNNLIISNFANRDKDHDHDTLSASPTLFIHSDTDVDTDNAEYLGLTYTGLSGGTMETDRATFDMTLQTVAPFATATGTNRDGADIILQTSSPTNSGTVYGVTSIGANTNSHTIGDTADSLFVDGKLEVDGATYFDGGFSAGGNLDMAGNDILNVDQITGNSTYITIGDVGAAAGHASANDDLLVGGILEVDGSSYFGSTVSLGLGVTLLASADRGGILLSNSWQTPDTFTMHTGTLANSILISEYNDRSYDFAHALQTNPTLYIQSANQSADEWISLTHDQTDGVIDVGTGTIKMNDNVGMVGNDILNVDQITGNSTYITVGDVGAATGHGLAANDDLLVGGKLEVDGQTYIDQSIFLSGTLQMSSGGSITTTSAGDLTFLPDTTGITIVGDAGSTSHTLAANDDLFVSGKLEADGDVYADGLFYAATGIRGIGDQYGVVFGAGSDAKLGYYNNQTPDALILSVGADSNGFIIAENADTGTDFGHTLQTNPTVFIHSADATDTTQWLSFAHDQTDGRIQTGAGNISIGSGSDSHSLTTPNDLFVSGKMEVDGVTYFDGAVQFYAQPTINDDLPLNFGTSSDAKLYWNTAQTPDALSLSLGTDSRSLLIVETGDHAVDMGHAQQTNPTIFIHSADATDTTQWLSFAHDQTNAVIESGAGNIHFNSSIETGAYEFSEDAGFVSAMDMSVSATPAVGTQESYTFKIDGESFLKMYAEADSSGGIQNEELRFYKPIAGEWFTDETSTLVSVKQSPTTATTNTMVTLEADGTNWSGGYVLQLITDDAQAVPFDITDGSGSVFQVSRAGSLSMDGNLFFDGAAGIYTLSNGNLSLVPNGTGITIIGDAGTQDKMGTPLNDDLFVSGRLEVDGLAYFDAGAISAGNMQMGNNNAVTFGSGQVSAMRYSTYQDPDALYIGVATASNSLMIGEMADYSVNVAHAQQTNPTIFIHSADATDTTQWLSLAHDQTNAVIESGAGNIHFNSSIETGAYEYTEDGGFLSAMDMSVSATPAAGTQES